MQICLNCLQEFNDIFFPCVFLILKELPRALYISFIPNEFFLDLPTNEELQLFNRIFPYLHFWCSV